MRESGRFGRRRLGPLGQSATSVSWWKGYPPTADYISYISTTYYWLFVTPTNRPTGIFCSLDACSSALKRDRCTVVKDRSFKITIKSERPTMSALGQNRTLHRYKRRSYIELFDYVVAASLRGRRRRSTKFG